MYAAPMYRAAISRTALPTAQPGMTPPVCAARAGVGAGGGGGGYAVLEIGPVRYRSMVGPIAAVSDSADGPHAVAIEPGSGVVLDGIDPAAGTRRPVAVMFEHGAVDVVHDVRRTQLERHASPLRHGRETFGVLPALLQPVHLVAPGCGLEDGMDLDHCRAPPPAGQHCPPHIVVVPPRNRQGTGEGETDVDGVWRWTRPTVTRCRTPSATAPAGRNRRDPCTKGGSIRRLRRSPPSRCTTACRTGRRRRSRPGPLPDHGRGWRYQEWPQGRRGPSGPRPGRRSPGRSWSRRGSGRSAGGRPR